MTDQIDFQAAAKARATKKASQEFIAKKSVVGHLLNILLFTFHFEFLAALGSLTLALQRLSKTGVYAKGGYLDQQGINWRNDK